MVPSLHDARAAESLGELPGRGCSQTGPVASPPRRALQQCQPREQALRNRQAASLSRHWLGVLTLLGPASLTLERLIATFGGPQQVALLAPRQRRNAQQANRADACVWFDRG